MDFDPSAFLAMDMTEDQDSVYTAPEVPQGFSPPKIPEGKIVVEGGLQMEQDVQIPVPVFGLLEEQDEPMEEQREANDHDTTGIEMPLQIDITESECNNTPQPSPGERTSSPCTKKVIHATPEESRFRKDIFGGHYERVKIFRLHCSICDRHLGCAPWFTERQMRMHKLLNVPVCRKCFEFYGDINFPIEDGSELYCCWCGEGGDCFCCSTCPKIVCKKCISRNFGADKIKKIDKNDDWSCFVCKPEEIWPHRAMMWGLQRWGRGMRQLVAMLSKEERQAKLSLDTSHCCPKVQKDFSCVGLPPKIVLCKIPMRLIAAPYQSSVKEVMRNTSTFTGTNNGAYVPIGVTNNQIGRGASPMNNLPPMIPEAVTRIPGNLSQQARPSFGFHARQQMQQVHRTMAMNRPSPYPMNRMQSVLRPGPVVQASYPQRIMMNQAQQFPYRPVPPLAITNLPQPPKAVDSERESILQRHLQPSQMDISSLEDGVRDVKDALRPTLLMLDQFNVIRNDLAVDFAKLTSYSERLSYNIKIAICNLAKVNTDLLESQKKMIDSRVSNVVNSIQSAVNNNLQSANVNTVAITAVNSTLNSATKNETGSKGSNPRTISPDIIEIDHSSLSKTPEPKTSSSTRVEQTMPATPSSSTEEVEDLAIAMLCEAVLEVEENKENKDDANKDQTTPVKEPQPTVNKDLIGKPNVKKSPRKRPHNQISSSKIQVIDLIDDEDGNQGTFDESYYCKKFKITPCHVLLTKLKVGSK